MKNTLHHVILTGLGALAIGGCALDEPPAAPDRDETSTDTAELSAQILAVAAAGASHQIKNLDVGQCLSAPTGRDNELLHLANCNSSDVRQRWGFVQVSASQPDTFYLTNQGAALCAEVNNGSNIAGELVDDFDCNGTTAEQWVQSFRLINGVAYQHYRHVGTGLCMDTVSGVNSTIMQWFCDPNNNAQTWLVLP